MVLCGVIVWRACQNAYAWYEKDGAMRRTRKSKAFLFRGYYIVVRCYCMESCQCPFCCAELLLAMLNILIRPCFRIAEMSQGRSAKNIHGSKGRYDRYCVRESDDAASGRLPGATENANLALRKRADRSLDPAVEKIKVANADAKNDAIV